MNIKSKILSAEPLGLNFVAFTRPISGALIAYAGLSLFDNEMLKSDINYFSNDLQFPLPTLLVYIARSTEFFGGIMLAIGLLTRPISFLLSFTMFIATFTANKGNIFSEGGYQSTALFILFVLYFFIGGGKYSLDYLIFNRRVKQ
jgi:putative oxidoreductase